MNLFFKITLAGAAACILLGAASCLKVEQSPLKNLGPVLIVAMNQSHTVGGMVSGLTTGIDPLVLSNNGGDRVSLNADGPFSFPTQVGAGAKYNAAVVSFDGCYNASCDIVSGGTGVVLNTDVMDVKVQCTTKPAC